MSDISLNKFVLVEAGSLYYYIILPTGAELSKVRPPYIIGQPTGKSVSCHISEVVVNFSMPIGMRIVSSEQPPLLYHR